MRIVQIPFCFFLLLLFLLIASSAAEAENEKTIRILIGNFYKEFSVSGIGLKVISIEGGKKSSYLFKQNILIINRAKQGLKINKNYVRGYQFIVSSTAGELAINGIAYGGTIALIPKGEQEIQLINEITLEHYLEGLISLELSPQWDITTMKVQAVVARTYALYQRTINSGNSHHMTSSVLHQLYQGIAHATGTTRRAVKETRGEILTWNGQPIMAVYHSCCGGKTESAVNVWGEDKPYLRGVYCGMCTAYEKYFWKFIIPRGMFYNKLREAGCGNGSCIESVLDIKRTSTNRIQQIIVRGENSTAVISGNELRSLFGFSHLRSTNFIIDETEDGYLHFLGTGNGHGVGLCQWGARARALRGETYYQILQYYYPGTQLKRAY
jgi:stage II sporulation protein D